MRDFDYLAVFLFPTAFFDICHGGESIGCAGLIVVFPLRFVFSRHT
jgi:hypothetical protein